MILPNNIRLFMKWELSGEEKTFPGMNWKKKRVSLIGR